MKFVCRKSQNHKITQKSSEHNWNIIFYTTTTTTKNTPRRSLPCWDCENLKEIRFTLAIVCTPTDGNKANAMRFYKFHCGPPDGNIGFRTIAAILPYIHNRCSSLCISSGGPLAGNIEKPIRENSVCLASEWVRVRARYAKIFKISLCYRICSGCVFSHQIHENSTSTIIL